MATGFDGALQQLASAISPLLVMGQGMLFTVASYLFGTILGARAAYKLKLHADNPQHNPLSSAIISFIVAAFMLYLPNTMDTIRMSVGLSSMSNSPLQYIKANSSAHVMESVVYVYAAFFGYIAVIRGLFLFNKMGEASKRGDELHRGITHLVGGVAATNLAEIVGWLRALFN